MIKRTLLLLVLPGALLSLAGPASASAAECAPDARKQDVRIQLWKEPHCRGPWIEVPFEGDGDRPDFRNFRHSDGDTYDVDDNRESAVVAAGHCVRFFKDRLYRGRATRLRCGRFSDRSMGLPEACLPCAPARGSRRRCAGATPRPDRTPSAGRRDRGL